MLYTQKTLSMLEYDKVTAILAEHALTEGARDMALRLVPVSTEKTVIKKDTCSLMFTVCVYMYTIDSMYKTDH